MTLQKLLLVAAVLSLGAVAHASPTPASPSAAVQMGYGYGNGQTVTCASDDGKRHYCNMDTRGGVQLSRQISGTNCVQGRSWGYDAQGVWVDKGCRADFIAGGAYGNGGYGQGPNGGQTVTCSSDDGDRHHCDLNTRSGVQLTRQISGTPCIEGQSWGRDMRGIWVDKGCRAEFTVGNGYGNGNGNGYGYGQGSGQTITCSSDDGERHHCRIDTRGGVQLTRQISGTPCEQGQSWGYDNKSVWVDHGCRAEFTAGGGYGGSYGYGQGQGRGQIVACSSDDGNRHYCSANIRRGVRLSRQISGTACIQGQTWGYDNQGIWVDRGCRAEFEVR